MDINITIVNWKMKDDIDRCLASLYADTKDSGLNVVVHVVDNSENVDGVKELLEEKYPEVNYINPGKNLGFGKAQNLGFSKVRARFYLALNPDTEFIDGSNTLRRMTEFMDKNIEVGIAGPKLLNPDGTVQYSCCRFPAFFDQIARRLKLDKKFPYFKKRVDYYLMRDFNHNKTVPVDWVIGSFIFARAELVEKTGFFDERYFMYFEDCDWCRKAWRAGFKVFYLHDIILKHGHRRKSADVSAWLAIFKNPIARTHIKSWLKYFMKWGLKNEHYGK
jgi:hypothetical protein